MNFYFNTKLTWLKSTAFNITWAVILRSRVTEGARRCSITDSNDHRSADFPFYLSIVCISYRVFFLTMMCHLVPFDRDVTDELSGPDLVQFSCYIWRVAVYAAEFFLFDTYLSTAVFMIEFICCRRLSICMSESVFWSSCCEFRY